MVPGVVIPRVPSGIEIAVIAVAAGVPLAALLSAGVGGWAAGVKRWLGLGLSAMGVFLAWGGVVLGLDALKIGWGASRRFTPVAEVIAFVVPPLIGVIFVRRVPRLRRALAHQSGLWRLASVQIARNLGLVFLILHAEGKLPGLFAYPAAWGDIAIGVTAPIAMWAIFFREAEIRRRGSVWQKAFIGWNLMGLADHIVAVTLGTLNFPGVTQVFGGHATTVMFAVLPMVLFPVYMVPFADMLHLIMIDVVRRPQSATVGAPAEAAGAEHETILVARCS